MTSVSIPSSRKSALSDMVDDPVFNNKKEAAPGHPVIRESQVEQEAQEDIQPLLTIGKKKAPPKLAARKPIVYYRTANNQIRRVYRNRCERYCLGPLSIVVDAVGVLVITMVNLVLLVRSHLISAVRHKLGSLKVKNQGKQ